MYNYVKLIIVTLFFCIIAIIKAKNNLKLRNDKKIILQLSKPIFDSDLFLIKKEMRDVEFVPFPRLYLSKIIRNAVINFEALSDNNYWKALSKDELEKIQFAIELFFRVYTIFIPFSAVVSGNYTYVSQQHLAKYCLDRKIPFIVLYKEGTLLHFRDRTFKEKIFQNKVVIATDIIVPNETVFAAFKEYGNFINDQTKLHLGGIPRLEHLHGDTPQGQGIVFFFYDPNQKSNFRNVSVEKLNRTLESILKILMKLSESHKITIKCKNRNEIEALTKFVFERDIRIEGITVTCTEDAQSLIYGSQAIISILSTTLIEARIINRTIFSLFGHNDTIDAFLASLGAYDVDKLESFAALPTARENADWQLFEHIAHHAANSSSVSRCAEIIRGALIESALGK